MLGNQKIEEDIILSTKIYIAAPWVDREKMEEIATLFEGNGCTITHRWWNVENIPEVERTPSLMKKQAEMDLNGVLEADAVVLINSVKSEGKAVEQGIALAKRIPIIAVGKRGEHSKNVFHYLPLYHWVEDVNAALIIMNFISALLKEDN